jgi:hypothetical protein
VEETVIERTSTHSNLLEEWLGSGPDLPVKTYIGRRGSCGPGHRGEPTVVVREDNREQPLEHHPGGPSPTGFEWGYGGSVPAELARCILWDHLGYEPPRPLYQHFKFLFLAVAPHEGFRIPSYEIAAWLGCHLFSAEGA